MVDVLGEYAFDKGPLSVADSQYFEELTTSEVIGEGHEQQNDVQFVWRVAEDRRLILRQLLAEVSRFRADYTWEW